MTPTNRTLVIMAKAPRLGCVKTRLSASLSPQALIGLYRCLLDDTIALARTIEDVDVAIMCPEEDVQELSRAVPQTMPIVPQRGKGLAAGLTYVFTHFGASFGHPVVAFNSDSPHLPVQVLEAAFDALENYDLVVGPTHDGGYYLVGARASHPDLFTSDGMGTANAFEALLARARILGLSTYLTEQFYDIDITDDLNRLAAELKRVPGKAPRTAKWLSDWASPERR